MPKAKLTFPVSDAKKLAVAASFSNVTLGNSIKIGNQIIVETSYRDPQSLIAMMELKSQVTGEELNEKTTVSEAPAKGKSKN